MFNQLLAFSMTRAVDFSLSIFCLMRELHHQVKLHRFQTSIDKAHDKISCLITEPESCTLDITTCVYTAATPVLGIILKEPNFSFNRKMRFVAN